ncbi:MFS transporter [Anaerobacillus alkalidiazotrophicus]|uniref:MFS transporter n=1 Tax=Anaerobacillus alkalidiazotrophicus TaxID=472963 RepID=A0A1S2M0Y4_9BACI|nr:MFS transporter [Anaerobacillus alkalidiazotrophicus]OIJ18180.1 MFS transporter [Anaerobacillus alkalidiazotrophicus]OIJ19659.1 MFS transporter [Anaerobacillus alkalidiazotrophicus]
MPKALWLLIIGMVINVTGASFLWPLNTIYIHQELGKSLSIAGLVLMANAGAGVIGNLIGGRLFDRIGGYKTILFGISITVVSAFTLVFFHSWSYYVVLLIGLGLGSGITYPSMYAMAGSVWPEGGRKAFNSLYVAQNVGVATGAALGGLVASFRFDYVFLANGIMYIIFFFIASIGFKNMKADVSSRGQTSILDQRMIVENKAKFKALLILCVGFIICWIAYVQWASTISVHTQALGISIEQYSLIWTVNGALIVLGQPVISTLIKRWFHTLKGQIYFGLAVFMLSFFVLAQAEVFIIFVVAMVILTIGEMFVWPAVPTIAHQLAPKGKEGFYQGVVNSIGTGGRMIGPFLGGVIADLFGMQVLLYSLMLLFSVGFISTYLYDRQLKPTVEQEVMIAHKS